MDLGVGSWPTGLPATARPAAAVEAGPRDPDAPDWWTGENTNEFLAEQGIVLQ